MESATGSVEAEGLRTSAAADQDAAAYVDGTLSEGDLIERAIARHRTTSP
ncbi:antitoxin VbhA family protein [Streptomyces sp. SYSU K21746]